MTVNDENLQPSSKSGVLQSRIRDRERQAALGRGLGALLRSRAAGQDGEPATQPLPQLDIADEPRPFTGAQPRALLERIQGLRKSGSGQALQALLDAYGSGAEGASAAGRGVLDLPEGEGVSIGGAIYPLAREFTVVMMDLERIHPNPFVPLSKVNKEGLDRLVQSIRAHGFLRPLVVMPSTLGNVVGSQTYWLISGERSWQAARLMGMQSVPVRIHEVSPREAIQMILADDLHAQRLPTMDRAHLCGVLHGQMAMTIEEMAERLAVPVQTVAQTLRFLALDHEIQESLSNQQLDEDAALALVDVEDRELRMELWRYALRYRWNGARVRRAVRARTRSAA